MKQQEIDIMSVLNNLSDVGSWASIVGLLITLVTLFLLWNIKKRFLFRTSVETHKAVIAEKSSEIMTLLREYEKNQHDIDELFSLVDVELRAVLKGADKHLREDVKKSRSMIKRYLSKPLFGGNNKFKCESSAREIKTTLSVVVAEFEHVKKGLLAGS